jgi:hypothetical protein
MVKNDPKIAGFADSLPRVGRTAFLLSLALCVILSSCFESELSFEVNRKANDVGEYGVFSDSTDVTATGFTLNWSRSSLKKPSKSKSNQLSYCLCEGKSLEEVTTLAACAAESNLVTACKQDLKSFAVKGKAAGKSYFYNIAVLQGSTPVGVYEGKEQNTTMSSSSSPQTPKSTASVSFTFPEKDNTKAGWRKRIAGTCSENGKTVDLSFSAGSGSATSLTATCSSGAFETYLDLSALTGTITVTASQLDTKGLRSAVVTRNLHKPLAQCATSTVRGRNLAGGLGGGAGTVSDPYVVCTADQLKALSGATATQSFVMGSDIYFQHGDSNGDGVVDVSDTDYRAGEGWLPMTLAGDSGTYFDGASFSLDRMYINRPASWVHLFGHVGYRRFQKLKVSNVDFTGSVVTTLGGKCAVVDSVHVSGKMTALAGQASGMCDEGWIINSSVTADVTATGLAAGFATVYSLIAYSKFEGTVSGGSVVGGILATAAGNGANGAPYQVSNSYAKGVVRGNSYVGGISGLYGTVTNSFFTGKIEHTGGATGDPFGGLSSFGSSVVNSFVTAEMIASGSSSVARLAGWAGTITNSFYDSAKLCQSSSSCSVQGTSAAGLERLFDRAQQPAASFDFADLTTDGYSNGWILDNGELKLWWEVTDNTVVPFTGSGTAASPFLIQSVQDLEKVASNPRWMGASFRLTTNIDLSTATAFTPIGREAFFYGSFDGGGFTVSNLSSVVTGWRASGFIPMLIFGNMSRLQLANAVVSGSSFVGTAVGYSHGSSLSQISATGSITGTYRSGGLAGHIGFGSLTRTSCNVTVSGADMTGGMYGSGNLLEVSDSYARGSVTGATNSGGFAGWHEYGSVRRAFASGHVTGTSKVGGMVGTARYLTLENSFATGNVSGNSATTTVGKLTGDDEGVTNWPSSNAVLSIGSCTNIGGGGCNTLHYSSTPATLSHFYNKANAPLSAWDWVTIWLEDAGQAAFPTLR